MYGSNTIKGDATMHDDTDLLIPDYDPVNPKPYPGDIKPGYTAKSRSRSCLKTQGQPRSPPVHPGHDGGMR